MKSSGLYLGTTSTLHRGIVFDEFFDRSGSEKAMAGAEERQLRYLFKLKQSANVKKLIGQIFQREG